jgi:hypothetical protein
MHSVWQAAQGAPDVHIVHPPWTLSFLVASPCSCPTVRCIVELNHCRLFDVCSHCTGSGAAADLGHAT